MDILYQISNWWDGTEQKNTLFLCNYVSIQTRDEFQPIEEAKVLKRRARLSGHSKLQQTRYPATRNIHFRTFEPS